MMDELIRIRLSSFDYRLLDQYTRQIIETVKRTGGVIKGPIPLPTRRRRWTVLRSPHKFDQSREQFEIREHRRILDITRATPQTIEALKDMSLPAGVHVELRVGR